MGLNVPSPAQPRGIGSAEEDRTMTKYKVHYTVWSFFFNEHIRFEKVVEARNIDDAVAIVKKSNPLAESVYVISEFAL
jgi:hypothetical protein